MNISLDDHSEFDELAVGWALYCLEPEDESHFAGHLHVCRRCNASVARSSAVMSGLVEALPTDDVPTSQLRERILGAIDQHSQQPPRPTAAPLRRVSTPSSTPNVRTLRQRWKVIVTAAALIAVIAGIAGWNTVLHEDRNRQAGLAQRYAHAIHDVTSPDTDKAELTTTAGTPVATVVVHSDTIAVVTTRMTQNKADRSTYVLWGMNPGHDNPTAVGTFDVTHTGINDSTVREIQPDGHFAAYAVSREPGRHAPTRPSAIIARGNVDA